MKNRVTQFFLDTFIRDTSFFQLLKNASWLTLGTVVAGAIGFLSILFTARQMGPAQFGVLITIMTYASIVDRLLNFQSWQFLIKNGSLALEDNNYTRFKRQLKFCALLDFSSSILSGLLAILMVKLIGPILNWTQEEELLAQLFAITIFFHFSGMPTGVARLFNRFNLLAMQKIVSSAILLLGVFFAGIAEGRLSTYVATFAVCNILGYLVLIAICIIILRQYGLLDFWKTSLNGIRSTEPGALKFIFFTNVESSVKIIRDLDVLVLKSIVNSESVGIYTLARKISEALHMLTDAFFYAIYPEFSKLVASKDSQSIKILVLKSSLTVGFFMLIVWAIYSTLSSFLVPTLFGTAFQETALLSVLCMLGSVIWAFAQPLPPLLFNMGYAKDLFFIHLFAAISYVLILIPIATMFGALGATITYSGFFALWSILISITSIYRYNLYAWSNR